MWVTCRATCSIRAKRATRSRLTPAPATGSSDTTITMVSTMFQPCRANRCGRHRQRRSRTANSATKNHRHAVVCLVAWLSGELARRLGYADSLVPQPRIQVRYVTVTKCVATAPPPKSQSCRSVRSWKISLTVPSAISRPRPHVAIAAGRTVKHEHIGTHCATTNFADNRYMVNRYGQLRRFTVCVDGASKHSIRQRNVLIGLI